MIEIEGNHKTTSSTLSGCPELSRRQPTPGHEFRSQEGLGCMANTVRFQGVNQIDLKNPRVFQLTNQTMKLLQLFYSWCFHGIYSLLTVCFISFLSRSFAGKKKVTVEGHLWFRAPKTANQCLPCPSARKTTKTPGCLASNRALA